MEIEDQLVGQRVAAHVADAKVVLVRDEMLGMIRLNPELWIALGAREVKVIGVFAREVHLQNTLMRYHLARYRFKLK